MREEIIDTKALVEQKFPARWYRRDITALMYAASIISCVLLLHLSPRLSP